MKRKNIRIFIDPTMSEIEFLYFFIRKKCNIQNSFLFDIDHLRNESKNLRNMSFIKKEILRKIDDLISKHGILFFIFYNSHFVHEFVSSFIFYLFLCQSNEFEKIGWFTLFSFTYEEISMQIRPIGSSMMISFQSYFFDEKTC